jgi:sugar/nucleoside kinase (ribokinase family)
MAPDTEPLDVLTIGEMVVDVTGAGDAFWAGFLIATLHGKDWPESIRFAHEVASLKLRVEGHVERIIDRQTLYASLKSAGQQAV